MINVTQVKTETANNYIKKQDITTINISSLIPHPLNRPLGKNLEKIEQLKESIKQYGFYSSQPLTIRLLNGKYQIIKGEHRYLAAKELGYTELPCVVEEMDDNEALIQLIIGNIQAENKPLEIGLNALEATKKDSETGYSISKYAREIGFNIYTVSEYVRSAEVYRFVLDQFVPGHKLIQEVKKLLEISRCPQSDWIWLHNTVVERELSKIQTELVCKTVRDIDSLTKVPELRTLFKLEQIKRKAADEVIENRNRAISNLKPAIETANKFYEELESEVVFYKYNIHENKIIEKTVDMHKLFVEKLKNLNTLSKSTVNQAIDEILREKQENSKEAAEQARDYYQKEKHNKELQERRRIKREQSIDIFDSWLPMIPIEDIAKNLNLDLGIAKKYLEDEKQRKLTEGLATFSDIGKKGGFKIPIYNIWKQQNKSNTPDYFGNSEIQWLENLLYLYTEPFDAVVDLFAGSGTTIDVCRKRSRRYWVGDKLPVNERKGEIHEWDIVKGLPAIDWEDIKLVYLDPPYWKQAEGKYSKDPTDLGNMDLSLFNITLSGLINSIGENLFSGYIALIIQPTQWNAPDRQFVDHIADMIKLVKLPINMRYSVPYESQQYNAQMVEWSKVNRKPLVLTREIIVWMK